MSGYAKFGSFARMHNYRSGGGNNNDDNNNNGISIINVSILDMNDNSINNQDNYSNTTTTTTTNNNKHNALMHNYRSGGNEHVSSNKTMYYSY